MFRHVLDEGDSFILFADLARQGRTNLALPRKAALPPKAACPALKIHIDFHPFGVVPKSPCRLTFSLLCAFSCNPRYSLIRPSSHGTVPFPGCPFSKLVPAQSAFPRTGHPGLVGRPTLLSRRSFPVIQLLLPPYFSLFGAPALSFCRLLKVMKKPYPLFLVETQHLLVALHGKSTSPLTTGGDPAGMILLQGSAHGRTIRQSCKQRRLAFWVAPGVCGAGQHAFPCVLPSLRARQTAHGPPPASLPLLKPSLFLFVNAFFPFVSPFIS